MKLKDRIQRVMIRIYLRYVSVVFCFIAGISLAFRRTKKPAEKKLLILKPDAIGDYILFRNFLWILRKSEKYRDYQVTFCGNSAYRDFAVHYDGDSVDNFLWIDKNRIYLNLLYYIRFAHTLYRQYSVTIHASRSRELVFDFFAKISSPLERITYNGDTVNILSTYKKMSDRWYTRIIQAGDIFSFEFEANKKFFEILLEQDFLPAKPFLEKAKYDGLDLPDLPVHFVAVFPGAQLPFRRWNTANFAAVCNYLRQKHGMAVVILGGKSDQKLAYEIKQLCDDQVVDLTGRTNLKQLPAVISRASLLITNDTMAVHFGAALGIPTVVISQMNHYGRFVPYPVEIYDKMICIIPPAFKNFDGRALTEKFRLGSGIDINLVTIEQVRSAADKACDNMIPVTGQK